MVGHDVTKKLLNEYTFDELLKDVLSASSDHITGRYSFIEGIGPEKSSAFVEWFYEDENLTTLNNLLTQIRVYSGEKLKIGNSCEGLTFVITGDVYQFRNRKELQVFIEANGGKVTGSVTKKTSFLINNNVNSTSGKNKKAKDLGIPIISETEFLARFGQ